jgi:hypothetical protein
LRDPRLSRIKRAAHGQLVAQTAPFGLRLFFPGASAWLLGMQNGKGNVPDDAGNLAKMISTGSNPMDHRPLATDNGQLLINSLTVLRMIFDEYHPAATEH